MKIADLTRIEDIVPFVGYSEGGDDPPLHIFVGGGIKEWGKHRRDFYSVTKCNRLIRWPYRSNGLGHARLCARCGTREDFEKALDDKNIHDIEVYAERRRKEALDEANRIAEANWSETWDAVGESIVEEAESIIASGKVVIPIEKDALAIIRTILRDNVRRFKRLKEPMYHQRDDARRIQTLLDDVLIY